MKRKNKIILIVAVAVVLIAAVVWYLFLRKPKTKTTDLLSNVGSGAATSNTTAAASGTSGASDAFPLQMGSAGPRVKTLQSLLNDINKNDPQLPITGNFGSQTKAALIKAMGEAYYPLRDVQFKDVGYAAGAIH
jgi:hypothetical protein